MTGAGLAVALFCCSCADLQLRPYRNDALVQQYRYALGEQYIELPAPAADRSSYGNGSRSRQPGNGDPPSLRLCYQELGQGDETILIIPGLGTSIDYWQLVIPGLAEVCRVVAVDPPGFGKSDKPDVKYDLPWIADQIVAFMDARGIERATLMGGSLGGHLAMLIAIDHPERVNRLVLMGSCGAWPEPGILAVIGLATIWQDPIVIEHLRRNWPKIYRDIVSSNGEVSRRLLMHQLALMADLPAYAPAGRAASRALKSIFYHSCRSRMDQIRVPALLIWGDNDQIHLLPEAAFLRQHLPDARLVIVPDSAHEVILDQPARFTDLVRRFLQHGLCSIEETPLPP